MKARFLLPLISVYTVGMFYPVKSNDRKDRKDIPYRPPGWVFGVVWPILLLLIGYSWSKRPALTRYYVTLTVLLSSWMVIYTYNRSMAFMNIVTTIALTAYMISYKFEKKSSYALVPLLRWLSFASYLSYNSI